eukprot:scaffold38188_cov67-Phaeocystis_antarctica.AAC.5
MQLAVTLAVPGGLQPVCARGAKERRVKHEAVARGVALTRELACDMRLRPPHTVGAVGQGHCTCVLAPVTAVIREALPEEGAPREVECELGAHLAAETELVFAPPQHRRRGRRRRLWRVGSHDLAPAAVRLPPCRVDGLTEETTPAVGGGGHTAAPAALAPASHFHGGGRREDAVAQQLEEAPRAKRVAREGDVRSRTKQLPARGVRARRPRIPARAHAKGPEEEAHDVRVGEVGGELVGAKEAEEARGIGVAQVVPAVEVGRERPLTDDHLEARPSILLPRRAPVARAVGVLGVRKRPVPVVVVVVVDEQVVEAKASA